jgi:hypothetical protein
VLASVCGYCGADVSQSPQQRCAVYDRIDIPPIAPEITGWACTGVCLRRAKRFKADAPAELEPGSPFGPNPTDIRLLLHPRRRLRAEERTSLHEAAIAKKAPHWTRRPLMYDLFPEGALQRRRRT